jgi:hypothetical protein
MPLQASFLSEKVTGKTNDVVTSLVLVDTVTGEDLMELTDGVTIDIAVVGTDLQTQHHLLLQKLVASLMVASLMLFLV